VFHQVDKVVYILKAFYNQIKHFLWYNYTSLLGVFVPLGLIAYNRQWDPVNAFILNLLALVYLADLLVLLAEEVAVQATGEVIGGLLIALGDASELIVCILRS
jgi:calcium/proton exchanger cax